MTESKIKYSDAQKRASDKYRMNNKDKLNIQRQSYYSKKKEEDPLYLEKKRQKSREYYLKKKNCLKQDIEKPIKSEIHYLEGNILYKMDVKNFEPCKLDDIDNQELHKSKLKVLIDNVMYKMDVEITGQRTIKKATVDEPIIEKHIVEEPNVEEPVKSELQIFLDSVMTKMKSDIEEEPKIEEPELILKPKKSKSKSKKTV